MNYRKRIAQLECRVRHSKELCLAKDKALAVAERTLETAKEINENLANRCNNQLAELRALREECAKLRMSEGEQH